MIGRVGGSQDSSFLCLLAIYAAHVLLFHVLAVAPLMGSRPAVPAATASSRAFLMDSLATSSNRSSYMDSRSNVSQAITPEPSTTDTLLITGPQLHHHQAFVRSSSPRLWENSMTNVINNYPKINVDFSLLLHYFHRIKSIFASTAWSSSTWGIISGCAIFLLTYTERDIAQ